MVMKLIEYTEFGYNGAARIAQTAAEKHKHIVNYYDGILNKPFNKEQFRYVGQCRVVCNVFNDLQYNVFTGIRCLDMPIKMAGSMEYRLPAELKQFSGVLSAMIGHEHTHNKLVKDFYAYLTVDQTVKDPGKTYHREGGLHVDGFQGARVNPKVMCDRSYIVVDCDPPYVYLQPFPQVVAMDDSKENIFHAFDKYRLLSNALRIGPKFIYFMDCYCVHSAGVALSQQRTFVRLSYSVRQYDRLGNSHNHLFDYNWPMFTRDIASVLEPADKIINEP